MEKEIYEQFEGAFRKRLQNREKIEREVDLMRKKLELKLISKMLKYSEEEREAFLEGVNHATNFLERASEIENKYITVDDGVDLEEMEMDKFQEFMREQLGDG